MIIWKKIPDLILNKIYWYLVNINRKDLCKEYHKRIRIEMNTYSNCVCNYDTCRCMMKDWFRWIKFDDGHYNYRKLDKRHNRMIINKNGRQICLVSKNYK